MHHVDITLIHQLRTLRRLRILGGNRGHRTTAILVKPPLDNINHMRTPVTYHTSAVLLVITPSWEMTMHPTGTQDRAITTHRAGANPHVPVQTRFILLSLQVTRPARSPNVDCGAFNFPNHSITHQFTGNTKFT